MLKDTDGRFALLKRDKTPWMNGRYCVPGGKVEKGEFFSGALIREAKEEIGVTIAQADVKHVLTMHYIEENDINKNPEWINVFFLVKKWEGVAQNCEPGVHSELAWFGPDDLPQNLVPGLKEAFDAVENGTQYIEVAIDDEG